ncbi:hypothetical protein QUF72_22095 [Desulfobacterales bacterium HSG2]|nr:hypothetical protein [Desulfobacterales bacterium HSG2]
MKKTILFAVICLFAVSGVSIARGQLNMGELTMPPGKWWQMPKMAETLNLSSEEQGKLDKLFVQNRRQLINLKSGLEREKFELELVLDDKNFNETACMNQFKKLQDARANLTAERFRYVIEVRKLLGLDRFQKIKSTYSRRMNRKMRTPGRKKPAKDIPLRKKE